ncbi:hypothetical protein [Geoglobus acetivorans]|uniref:Uncharacterized protein n=1 Tax=Geoglobus acetivorans TaxID=565033 RepID=A0ABZ3H2Z2_GEOAI|nr:hypothetical protein [Geoglobus acetivorans]
MEIYITAAASNPVCNPKVCNSEKSILCFYTGISVAGLAKINIPGFQDSTVKCP